MRRRDILAGAAGVMAALANSSALADQMPRVGVLLPGEAEAFWTVLKDALRERGYIEGQNISFELRVAGQRTVAELAAELVRLEPAAIVAHQTPAAQAAKAATRDIPIVTAAGDLVATGLVASLSRPGGNVTGVSGMTPELAGKCVELLREIAPNARHLAVLSNAIDPFTRPFLDHVTQAARLTNFALQKLMVRSAQDIEITLQHLASDPADALLVQPSLPRRRAFDFGRDRKIPTASPFGGAARAGALISYNADPDDLYRMVAGVVEKVLRGADPASVPVALPTKFNLAINMKTAQAIGVVVPPSLLARADEVIE